VYRSGSMRRLAEWIDRFPPDFVGADAARAAAYSQVLFWINRPRDADRWSNLARDLAGPEPPLRLGIAIALPKMMMALGRGETDRVREQLAHLCRRYGPDVMRADREAMLPTVVAVAALVDEAPDARACVRAIACRPDIPERVVAVGHPTRSAWELFQRGRLDEAQDLADAALDAGARDGNAAVHAVVELYSLLAMLHLERHELEVAADWAALRRRMPSPIRARYALLAAEIEARTGAPKVAAEWLHGLPATPRRGLVEARIALDRGRYEEVGSLLAGLGPLPLARRVEADLLLARIPTQRQALERALDAGGPAGFVWTFLRDDPAVVDAVRRRVEADPHPHRTALGRHLAGTAGSADDKTATRVRQSLTPMELTVLRQLPTHRTYGEIAAELVVSVNTVKTHVRSVHRKLGVGSRAEAVRRAAALGLLD